MGDMPDMQNTLDSKRILYIDADTILFSSAAKEDIRKCLVTNTTNGKTRMFESKTAFNNWFIEKSVYDKSVYTFHTEWELVGQPSFAFKSVRDKIDAVVEAAGCDDFRVCIQGEGNYRYSYNSKYVDYKGQREGKPTLYHDTYDYAKRKYKDKCIVVNGEEVDDYICKLSWQHWDENGSISTHPIVIAYVDKDLQQNCVGPMLNYFHKEDGIVWNSREKQYKGFWGSVLTGDAADNIPGIRSLGTETKKRYGIKSGGCGKVGAARILCTAESEKECCERVIAAYKESWPEDYMERLQDMCFFLWLRREEDETFSLNKYLDKLQIIR